MSEKRFIVRVYGLFLDSKGNILLADEYHLDTKMTKFPGGGLEFGEGTIDCLKREAMEEMGQEIEVLEHFYTTDFFQPTAFFDNCQLLSIYYFAKCIPPIKFETTNKPFDFELKNGNMAFRWAKLSELNLNDLTFPVDKKVLTILKKTVKL